jgi:hypothetical protein
LYPTGAFQVVEPAYDVVVSLAIHLPHECSAICNKGELPAPEKVLILNCCLACSYAFAGVGMEMYFVFFGFSRTKCNWQQSFFGKAKFQLACTTGIGFYKP